jgi:rRNA-processing protein FCF1
MPSAPKPAGPSRGSASRGSASRGAPSPLEGTDRLVVDGTNLLYRLGRGGAAPPAAAVGRLRAAVPATIAIDLVFDGAGHGISGRVAQGMQVRYAGRRSADDAILELADTGAQAAGGGPAATARVLVVTDDRDLRARLMAKGVRTVPLAWLTNRLDMPRLASAAPGNRRPALGTGGAGGATPGVDRESDRDDRPGWKPGRGATAKAGPAHKVARHRRHPKHGG